MNSHRMQQAIEYARYGYQVFPVYGIREGKCACGKDDCEHPGKHPMTPKGLKDATSDPKTVQNWFTSCPDANIGIRTGRESGLLALDIDPKNDGYESLQELVSQHGDLPNTQQVITGGGGIHFYFEYPNDGKPIPNAANLGGFSGIDFKGDNGYIVAPDSDHMSGGVYDWEISSSPDLIGLAVAPNWLLQLCRNGKSHISQPLSGQSDWPTEALTGVEKGMRNETCFKLACRYRQKGLSQTETNAILVQWGSLCNPPLAIDEIADCINSAFSYEKAESNTSSKLTLTALSDLVNEPEEEIDWLWEDRLIQGGLSIVAAKPKVGKSTLARNLALKVSQGEAFFGLGTSGGPVVYLALEEKRSEVRKHFSSMGGTQEKVFTHVGSLSKEGLSDMERAINEVGAVLAIVDPLFRAIRIRDTNDYAVVTAALEPLMEIARNSGCHILAVHHMGKMERDSGDGILGSTAIFGAVDTALIMRRSDTRRTIESVQRYGSDMPKTVIEYDSDTGELQIGSSIERIETEKAKASIIEYLSVAGDVQESEICKEIGGNNKWLRKAIRELSDDGTLLREGAGRKGSPYLFSLKETKES